MKKILLVVVVLFIMACNRDAHCPAYNTTHDGKNQPYKDHDLKKTKKGKSNLFPKQMR